MSGKEIVQDRLALLEQTTLHHGSHNSWEGGHCAMEVAAWLAGEDHGDAPACVCPVIRSFVLNWNDSLKTDEDRNRLIRPLLPKVLGTRAGKAEEITRSYMAFDWLVRVHTPTWLDLTPSLADHAKKLRKLPELKDGQSVEAAIEAVNAACAAARDAARVAACAAVWAAAWEKLAPTVARLQASAADLVERMCAVGVPTNGRKP